MIAIVLALASSVSYGISDYIGGLKSRSLPLPTVLLVSHAAALAAIAATLLIVFENMPDARYFGYAMLAGVAEAIGIAALYRGLAIGKMSIVAAVAATSPIVPVIYSLVTGDTPTALQGLGIVVAVGGVCLLALGSSDEDEPVTDQSVNVVGVSVIFGLLTALGLGSFLLAMDASAEGSVQWGLLTARFVSVSIFTLVFLVARPAGDLTARDWGSLVLIGVLILLADSLFAIATTRGLLSVVAVLSSLYPVVTILLARYHLGEHLTRQQISGIAIVLVGAAALSAG